MSLRGAPVERQVKEHLGLDTGIQRLSSLKARLWIQVSGHPPDCPMHKAQVEKDSLNEVGLRESRLQGTQLWVQREPPGYRRPQEGS